MCQRNICFTKYHIFYYYFILSSLNYPIVYLMLSTNFWSHRMTYEIRHYKLVSKKHLFSQNFTYLTITLTYINLIILSDISSYLRISYLTCFIIRVSFTFSLLNLSKLHIYVSLIDNNGTVLRELRLHPICMQYSECKRSI